MTAVFSSAEQPYYLGTLDEAARNAVRDSLLAEVSTETLDQLLADAVQVGLPAGSVIYRAGATPRHANLVVKGLVRTYMTSPEGRQVTVRYGRPGDLIGVVTLIGGPSSASVQALTHSSLLLFKADTLQSLARADSRLAWAVAQELSRLLYGVLEELAGNVFGTVRQRVARHLLDLAANRQKDRALVAQVSHQEIADAVGSVRVVVTRVLHELRDDGLVESSPSGIVLLDPAHLHAEARLQSPR